MRARAFLLSGLAFAAAGFGARSAEAQSFHYCDFSSVSTLTLNGNATQSGSILQLTPNTANQSGSAFQTTPLAWSTSTSFFTSFRFELEPNLNGADGMAFVIQNAATGASAIGSNGGALGYGLNGGGAGPGGGIANSIEVEFDTLQNAWDTNANHVAILQNGNDKAHLAQATPGFTMADFGDLYAWVDYDAPSTTLSVFVSNTFGKPATPLLKFSIDVSTSVGAQAYFGFTGGTDATNTNVHEVLEWQFSTTGEPCACGGDTACGGTTPICDTSAQTCRACTSDADCLGTTPVCAKSGPLVGSCVGCTSDTSCDADPNTATPICSTSGGTTDTCVACTTNAGCVAAGLEPLCDTTSPYPGQCVECLGNADCTGVPDDPACVSTGLTTLCGCLTSADCTVAAAPFCDTAAHQCGPCTVDGECSNPATPACMTTGPLAGQCTPCGPTDTSECTGTSPTCDDTTGQCVGCLSDAYCSGTTPICSTTTDECVPCASNADCAPFAGMNTCQSTPGPEQGACVQCVTNTDCTVPTGECNPATFTCVGCLTNADCSGLTPICHLGDNTCWPCTADTDCTAPTAACADTGPLAGECVQCSATNGTACVTGSSMPVCVPDLGQCGCATTKDCGKGQVCEPAEAPAGQCVAQSSDAGPEAGDAGHDAGHDAAARDSGFDAGHFMDASKGDGAIGDTGSIGGGGCACSATGSGERPFSWAGGLLAALLAAAAWAARRRKA